MSPTDTTEILRRLECIDERLTAHLAAHDELMSLLKKGLIRLLFGVLTAAGATAWAWFTGTLKWPHR